MDVADLLKNLEEKAESSVNVYQSSHSNGMQHTRRKVIIDTDAGIDDAQAILLALADPTVEITAITCVGGNTALTNACRNVLKVLTVTQRLQIPVFPGCEAPLIGNQKFKPPFYGEDGLGDCAPEVSGLGEIDMGLLQKEPASVALIRYAKQFPDDISLVCLGPLTNVAIAMKIDQGCSRRLRSIHIMGGNHSGEGNETATAEYNFHHDPEAANIVLSNAECEVGLLGWETCDMPVHRFSYNWVRDSLYCHDTNVGRFLRVINGKILELYEGDSQRKKAGFRFIDELLMAVFLDPSVCTKSCVWPTNVELGGIYTRGQCVVDKRYNKFGSSVATNQKTQVRHVLGLDTQRVQQMFSNMILNFK